jgi:release factor glutamine methyltransferase
VLLCHSLGREREYLYSHPEAELGEVAWVHYGRYLHERLQGKPTQYITRRQEFYGREFTVTPDVLIPRPETEHVVEAALARGSKARRIVDVGCGSGAIAVTLALEMGGEHHSGLDSRRSATTCGARFSVPPRPSCRGSAPSIATSRDAAGTSAHATPHLPAQRFGGGFVAGWGKPPACAVYGTDISPAALAVAASNARRLGARVHFVACDLVSAFAPGSVDMIVSNPPYVPLTDAPGLQREVRDWEPHVALFAGETGLEIYCRLVAEAERVLAAGGALILELGFKTSERVQAMLGPRWRDVEILPDLAGIPRVLAARLRPHKAAR